MNDEKKPCPICGTYCDGDCEANGTNNDVSFDEWWQ